jgi:hypothetical protein
MSVQPLSRKKVRAASLPPTDMIFSCSAVHLSSSVDLRGGARTKGAGVEGEEQREVFDRRCLTEVLAILDSGLHYFSHHLDLTTRLQAQGPAAPWSRTPEWARLDSRFVWNAHLLTPLLAATQPTTLRGGGISAHWLFPLVEGFVGMELKKQCGWSRVKPGLFHFRSHEGSEVDFILEEPSGRLVGVEVKASTTVAGADFKGLRYLADRVPKRFHRGVVLYTGNEMLPFGPKLCAVPLRALWRWAYEA